MATINQQGYLQRTEKNRTPHGAKSSQRDWWLPKYCEGKKRPRITLHTITFPEEYVGKRVRFKVEVLEDKNKEEKDNEIIKRNK